MLILKYFLFAGGFLLSLMFAADRYLPRAAEQAAAKDVDRSIIRIRTARPVPAKVEFDTSHPMTTSIAVEPALEQREERPRQALALMTENLSSPPVMSPALQQHNAPLQHKRIRHASRAVRPVPERSQRQLAYDHRDLFAGW
jgi:hypothetical protein